MGTLQSVGWDCDSSLDYMMVVGMVERQTSDHMLGMA